MAEGFHDHFSGHAASYREFRPSYGPAVTEAARKNADAVKAKMVAGGFDIFAGEMKDNTGKVVIPKGKVFKQTDLELEGMNYLIEGVIGKI